MDNEERGVGGREIRVLFDSGRNQQGSGEHGKSEKESEENPAMRRRASTASGGYRNQAADDNSQRPLGHKQGMLDEPSTTHAMSEFMPTSSATDSESLTDLQKPEEPTRRSSPQLALSRSSSSASQAVFDDEDDGDNNSAGVEAIHAIADDRHPNPGQTRNTADIRFAELPMPRKTNAVDEHRHSRRASNHVRRLSNVSEPQGRDDTELSAPSEVGESAFETDGLPRSRIRRRRASSVSKFAGRSTTLERTITSAFRRRRDSSPGERSTSRARELTLPYISFQPTVGRNSAFTSLTKEQRAELGGIEYRATKTLCKVLVGYYFFFLAFGFVCFLAFIYSAQQWIPAVNSTGTSRGWWSVFTSASTFNDLGLALNPDSFASFQTASFILLISSFLIVIGNTGFPCMLRFVIWLLYKIWPNDSAAKEELAFLLDHPRRCFTLLFPSSATWWLLAVLFGLNALDLLLFIVLDLGNTEVVDIPVGYRIVDGLFQAFCTRTAGFTVVNIGLLHSAILVSYMIMMYISVFPVAISIRRTNVYEERSLGIYTADEEEHEAGGQSFLGTHVRRQLSHDLWYIFLALFVICIIENPEIQNANLQSFNIFNVLFEIVSAYGTVGLSIGFPGVDYSFSGQFHTLSKLVIIALEIRGRHRGLPLKLDRAILLPSDKLTQKEEEDGELRLGGSRSISRSMARQQSSR